MINLSPIIINLCRAWVARGAEFQPRGKNADRQCMAYFMGAGMALKLSGHDGDASEVVAFAASVVLTLGVNSVANSIAENS